MGTHKWTKKIEKEDSGELRQAAGSSGFSARWSRNDNNNPCQWPHWQTPPIANSKNFCPESRQQQMHGFSFFYSSSTRLSRVVLINIPSMASKHYKHNAPSTHPPWSLNFGKNVLRLIGSKMDNWPLDYGALKTHTQNVVRSKKLRHKDKISMISSKHTLTIVPKVGQSLKSELGLSLDLAETIRNNSQICVEGQERASIVDE